MNAFCSTVKFDSGENESDLEKKWRIVADNLVLNCFKISEAPDSFPRLKISVLIDSTCSFQFDCFTLNRFYL